MSPAVPSDRRRCLVARHVEGAAILTGGWSSSQESPRSPNANSRDHRTRLRVIARTPCDLTRRDPWQRHGSLSGQVTEGISTRTPMLDGKRHSSRRNPWPATTSHLVRDWTPLAGLFLLRERASPFVRVSVDLTDDSLLRLRCLRSPSASRRPGGRGRSRTAVPPGRLALSPRRHFPDVRGW